MSSSREVVIVKVDGDILTHKKTEVQVNHDGIKDLVAVISEVYKRKNSPAMVIVHGIGEFARRSSLLDAAGQATSATATRAKSQIHSGIAILNASVVKALCAAGVPAFNLTTFLESNDSLSGKVKSLLSLQSVPVISSDVTLSPGNTIHINGSDMIVSSLARALPCTRVVFLTDADGVFGMSPADDSFLIRRMNQKDTVARPNDSPGMVSKLTAAQAIAGAGIDVFMTNCHSMQNSVHACTGTITDDWIGTHISNDEA
ncbi:Aspartate/glutamate/uridylate kinase domain-containing protein [Plasmodiophora brassicae]|uniref:Aspartate/glutamate/uridylate kinase domain-containing protein n=1 Tax=Plasmodiophora brassicae TaxID=37360 RepID=A0A0G4ILJ0_PLABS|nr:hypothetical protein PBRA_004761 [Plasmodiophora brassicae]SPQ93382.1 unnamed protein product [Plasmodiophora brassicae]